MGRRYISRSELDTELYMIKTMFKETLPDGLLKSMAIAKLAETRALADQALAGLTSQQVLEEN